MPRSQLARFEGKDRHLNTESWLAYAETPDSLEYAQQLVAEEMGPKRNLEPEPNFGLDRLEWLPHQRSKQLQQAYKQLENDNLSLLLEFGEPHLTQINSRLTSQLEEARTALQLKKQALEDLNQTRKTEHKEAMDRFIEIENRWRRNVQSLVDIYINK